MKTAFFALMFLLTTALCANLAMGDPVSDGLPAPIVKVPTPDSATATPPVLHDPIAQPLEALGDLRQAKRQGWALLAFAVLVMLTRVGVVASQQYKSLAFLAKGHVHLALAAIAAFSLAAYNALALGGSLYAALIAAGGVALYAILPQPKVASAASTQQ